MLRRRRALGTLTALAITVAADRGLGAPKSEAEIAKAAAYQAFGVSDYDTAIAEYKKAYLLTNDARLFYNLGLAHRKRFQLKRDRVDALEARDYFHRFVELFDSAREQAAERQRLEQMQTLARGYITELEMEVAKLDQSVAPPPPPPPVSPPAEGKPRRWDRIALVVAGGLAVAGGVTGVLALKYEADATDANAAGDIERVRSTGDMANRFALTTDVLIGAAVVSTGIGLYLALARPSSHKHVTVLVSPSGAAAMVRF